MGARPAYDVAEIRKGEEKTENTETEKREKLQYGVDTRKSTPCRFEESEADTGEDSDKRRWKRAKI